jgi:hypothetical protein
VVGRIHLELAKLNRRGDPLAHVVLGIKAALAAFRVDANWPWPIFQVVEMIELAQELNLVSAVNQALLEENTELSTIVALSDIGTLREWAAKLAAEYSKVVQKRDLGGRTHVFTLDDSHMLLNRTIVIKETDPQNARIEIDSISNLGKYLARVKAPTFIDLPEPFAVIDAGKCKTVSYVMRRAIGKQLGRYLLEHKDEDNRIFAVYERVVDCLAYFHAWRYIDGEDSRSGFSSWIKDMRGRCRDGLTRIGLPRMESHEFSIRLTSLLPDDLPSLGKKDAHAENWLIAPGSRVVILDLESTASLPVLCELAQLLESYPFLDQCDESWAKRSRLIKRYIERLIILLPDIEISLKNIDTDGLYELFCIYWVACSLRFALRDSEGKGHRRSSSEIAAGRLRLPHYLSLVKSIADRAESSPIRDCASNFAKIISRDHIKIQNKNTDMDSSALRASL